MVFSVAFTFGIAPSAGSELSFTAFPRVLDDLPAGDVLGIAFFTLLFVAGFTSCVGMAVVVVSAAGDEFGLGRRAAALATVALVIVAGVPSALSFVDDGLLLGGRPVLDRVDQFTGSGVVVVLGLLGALVIARRVPRRRLVAALGADPVRVGRLTLGPRALIAWGAALPPTAVVVFAIASLR